MIECNVFCGRKKTVGGFAMIDMKDVSKVYENGAMALDHINVHIDKGEFVFIVGASGAGKSTFIRMLFREVLPSSGSLIVNGQDVVHMEHGDVPYLRRGLGVIFQDYRLLPDKTVAENVAFAMQVIEAPRRKIQHSVNAVLAVPAVGRRAAARRHRPGHRQSSGAGHRRRADGQSRPGYLMGYHGHFQAHQRRRNDHRDGDPRQRDRGLHEAARHRH